MNYQKTHLTNTKISLMNILSLVLLAATIGLVVWAFVSWLGPLLPPSDIQTVIQEAEQSGVVFE